MCNPLFARKIIRAVAGICLLLLAALAILYFRQHSMVTIRVRTMRALRMRFQQTAWEINYTVATANIARITFPVARHCRNGSGSRFVAMARSRSIGRRFCVSIPITATRFY